MPSNDLNNVSYVTLALIGRGGASPQDLVDMIRRGAQIYYAVAPSRLYAEPKRLEELGYVSSAKRPGKTRERTFYTLTQKGLDALREWALQPPAPVRIQNEAIVKLISGDIAADDEALGRALLTLRGEIDAQEQKLDEARLRLDELAHRKPYLLLTINLGMRLLEAQREWLDDVERELMPGAANTE
jgi:DNA-binding PadR family transcriptional regulator